ncbi:MAG: Rpn family recombination-promoting nuclease/putative transposase, partial [Anaeroplasmataceae bacterium]|nr:Rpn family recombination-promoting nuclease/putative transposase [Anaeroplasmataceae bacterium]
MSKEYLVKYNGLNDFVFKQIFSNKRILATYLRELGIDVDEKELSFDVLEVKKDIHSKGVRFDIRVKDKNTRINLEAQRKEISGKNKEKNRVSYLEYQNHRKIHYISVLHSEAYQEGEQYFEKPKSYVIFFLERGGRGKGVIQRTKLINLETKEIYDDIEIIEIVLKNIKRDARLKMRMLKVLGEKDLEEYVKEENIVGEVA